MRQAPLLIAVAFVSLTTVPSPASAQFGRHFGLPSPLGILNGVIRGPHASRPRARHNGRRSQTAEAEQSKEEATAQYAAAAAPFNPYEDMLGYALWPDTYASRFWSHGFRDILQAMLKDGADGEGACAAQAKDHASRPLDRVEKAVDLSGPQRDKLAELRSAVNEAVERGQSACLKTVPGTPGDRLKATMTALWAISDADILFRTPLDAFYASLSDDQKTKLRNNPDNATVGGPVNGAPNGQTCDKAANDVPVAEMMGSTQPRRATAQQREGMKKLQELSADLSTFISSACPQETPATPVERLDAAGNRVQALLYAGVNLDQAMQASGGQQGQQH